VSSSGTATRGDLICRSTWASRLVVARSRIALQPQPSWESAPAAFTGLMQHRTGSSRSSVVDWWFCGIDVLRCPFFAQWRNQKPFAWSISAGAPRSGLSSWQRAARRLAFSQKPNAPKPPSAYFRKHRLSGLLAQNRRAFLQAWRVAGRRRQVSLVRADRRP